MILSICPPHAALEWRGRSRPPATAASTSTRTRSRWQPLRRSRRSSRRAAPAMWTAASSACRPRPPEPPVYLSGPLAGGARLVRPVGAGRADRRRARVRGVGGQDGLRGVDQGDRGLAARRPRARPGRGRGADAACRVGDVAARAREAVGASARPRRPRVGAGSPRWRRSPRRWPRSGCRPFTRRPRRSSIAPPRRRRAGRAARRRTGRRCRLRLGHRHVRPHLELLSFDVAGFQDYAVRAKERSS